MSSDGDSFVDDAPESSEWRPSRSSEPKRSKNFKMASAYGSVATSQDSGAKRGQHFDPWDQLRIQVRGVFRLITSCYKQAQQPGIYV